MIKDTPRISQLKAKLDEEDIEEEGEEEFDIEEMFKKLALGTEDNKELEDRGIILLQDLISRQSLKKIYERLIVLHFNKDFNDDIQIIINSPGGYCDAGWALIDLMDFVKNKITTIAMGEICSMATCIFIAGDERIMSPNSTAMIHQFSMGKAGNYANLVASRKIEDIEQAKDIRHLIRCSKYNSVKDVEKYILKPVDNWLTPQEMKKHGLCDHIFSPTKKTKK